MATQRKSSPVSESIDAATERVVALNEKILANGKKAGAAILGTYEKTVVSLTESYEKAAGPTTAHWTVSAPGARDVFTRTVANENPSAARALDSSTDPLPPRDGRGAVCAETASASGCCRARRKPCR